MIHLSFIKLSQLCGPLLLALPWPALAATPEDFLGLRNEATLARSFELPALGRPQLLAAGESDLRLQWDLSNEYHRSSDADEAVLLDGETQMLRLSYRSAPAPRWEWGAELPLAIRGGGLLDSTIDGWHSVWGLPDGNRSQSPTGQYRYIYRRDGRRLLDLDEGGSELGDLRVSAGWQARPHLALRSEVQLPTGDADTLGGGNLGAALWLDAALPLGATSRWRSFGAAGISVNRSQGPLDELRNPVLGLAGAGLAWRASGQLELLAQLYGHSRLYHDAQLDPFRPGLQLALGARWKWSDSLRLDLAFQEDPVTASSPDFALHAALTTALPDATHSR